MIPMRFGIAAADNFSRAFCFLSRAVRDQHVLSVLNLGFVLQNAVFGMPTP